jgi:estrogen-related receptor beta like 1
MDALLDTLKLLNYQKSFCRRLYYFIDSLSSHFLPLHRYQFVFPGQQEQFFYFVSLTAWLLNLNGVSCNYPAQFDDPNATLAHLGT